jgi:hypothetical protein
MRERPNLPVEIKGLAETLSAMRQFEPDLAKNLNKEVRAALTPVQKKAQSYIPTTLPGLSNWLIKTKGRKINSQTSAFATVGHFPKFNSGIAKRGIKVHIGRTKPNRNGFVTYYQLSNITAAGAILETAGRKHAGGQDWNYKSSSKNFSHSKNPKAGKWFIEHMGGQDNLQGSGKERGRILYRAWNEDEGKALAHVYKAVNATIVQFAKRSEAQVFRDAA